MGGCPSDPRRQPSAWTGGVHCRGPSGCECGPRSGPEGRDRDGGGAGHGGAWAPGRVPAPTGCGSGPYGRDPRASARQPGRGAGRQPSRSGSGDARLRADPTAGRRGAGCGGRGPHAGPASTHREHSGGGAARGPARPRSRAHRRKGDQPGGDYLRLQAQGTASPAQIEVFVAERHGDRFGLDRFAEGDAIEVTGVVGQYDFEPPYDEYYQIEPRGRDDLAQVGWPSTYLRAALLILAGGGLVGGIVVIGLRAAVQRRTQELEESRARFRRLAEATLEGIALHEADGTIVDANASLAQMMDTDREALIGKDITALLASAPSVHWDRAEGRTDAPVETELVHADGMTTPVEVETRTVTTGDEPVHVCAVRDLSKRKEWEDEMLRAKQEAEEPHRSFALQIRESGRRLSDTLQSVLDMAQIESGTLEVTVQEVSVPGGGPRRRRPVCAGDRGQGPHRRARRAGGLCRGDGSRAPVPHPQQPGPERRQVHGEGEMSSPG
nr:PAS domain-containing protein [Salinibacter ruber]